MMYAGSKNRLVQTAELTKVPEARVPQCQEEGSGAGSEGGGRGAAPRSESSWIIMLRFRSVQVFEIRTTDDLTEAWLQEKLSFFR